VTTKLQGRERLEAALSQPDLAGALEYFRGVDPLKNMNASIKYFGDEQYRRRFQELLEKARAEKTPGTEHDWPPVHYRLRRGPKTPEELRANEERRRAKLSAAYARQRQEWLEKVEQLLAVGASRARIMRETEAPSWRALQRRLSAVGRPELSARIRPTKSDVARDRLRKALQSTTLEEAQEYYPSKSPRDGLRRAVQRFPEFRKRYDRLAKDYAARHQAEIFSRTTEASAAAKRTTRAELERRFGVTWEAIRVRLKRAGRLDLARKVPAQRVGNWV
jgi:hypothetical protein